MKNGKKLLAGMLGAAMMLSSMTAFAADQAPTIDMDKKGSVTIEKYAGTDTTTPLPGVEFTIYKVADLVQSAEPSVELKMEPAVDGIEAIDESTTYADIQDAVDAAVADGSLSPAKDPVTTALNADGTKATAVFGELDLGVYLVVETDAPASVEEKSANFLVSVPMTDAEGSGWIYDVTAQPKNVIKTGEIGLEKQVYDGQSWGKTASFGVGDTISYRIIIDVPGNVDALTGLTVADTMENLAVSDLDGVSVYAITETLDTDPDYEEGDMLWVTPEETENGFSISFEDGELSDYAGGQIAILYDAVLTDGAVTTVSGNVNTAALSWTDANGEAQSLTDTATVHTYKINVNKTGENDAKLAGVVFDLYKETADGTITGDAAKALGLDSAKKWEKIDTLTTDGEGVASANGLANGTYYLVETKTNEGYNLLKAPVEVELNIAYDAVTEKFTGTDDENGTDAYKNVHVINRKGFTLPVTGGRGTLIVSLIGVLLVIGGAIVVIRASRKNA